MDSKKVLEIFKEITTVPRESGHEEKIIKWLLDFGKKHKLGAKKDKVGNVLLTKKADKGMEKVPTIIMQSHCDMVCEKNQGVKHDFAKDPISYCIEDGWMIAKDTTLGADCGIGMAAQLAALTDPKMKTGKLEALFTISEETGLDGAEALEPGFATGKILLNLDSEDEGELCIGCNGGIDTTAVFTYKPVPQTKEFLKYKVRVFGSQGGHSGDDINKNRVNANQMLMRFLYKVLDKHNIELYEIDGGNKRNAIPRDAHAIFGFPKSAKASVVKIFNQVRDEVKAEFAIPDPGVQMELVPVECKLKAIDANTAASLIFAGVACPHGSYKISDTIPGLIEISTNFASIKMKKPNKIVIGSSQRSAVVSERRWMAQQMEACWAMAGAKVTHEGEYPGWIPKLNSPILEHCKKVYRKLFKTDAKVIVTPAGLECGLFSLKFPDWDMISFGPTLRGVHAPGEKLNLASLDKFVKFLEQLLVTIK